jgi:hypothetical protein
MIRGRSKKNDFPIDEQGKRWVGGTGTLFHGPIVQDQKNISFIYVVVDIPIFYL